MSVDDRTHDWASERKVNRQDFCYEVKGGSDKIVWEDQRSRSVRRGFRVGEGKRCSEGACKV